MKKPIGISPARRSFLMKSVSIAPAAALGAAAVTGTAFAAPQTQTPYSPTYFSAKEWATLNAIVDRLIPADAEGPGAIEAGVTEFLDRQMDTPYAHGELFYMHGPFVDAPPQFGYQLKYPPRDVYRIALAGLAAAIEKSHGKAIDTLDADARDAIVHQLDAGTLDIGEIPAKTFFAQLLQNTHEGYFCDPKYGGNKNMDAWRMIGFPGARADYMDWVEQYGKKYPLPPVSIG